MSTPYIDPKTGTYKLCKRIPDSIHPVLEKREYWKSLGTKGLEEEKRLFPDALAECSHDNSVGTCGTKQTGER